MANLTKKDLRLRISNETSLPQARVRQVINLTLAHIMESMSKGRPVELRDFGVFKLAIRKARVGRNPNKPENVVLIPERYVVKFKSGKNLEERVFLLSSRLEKGLIRIAS